MMPRNVKPKKKIKTEEADENLFDSDSEEEKEKLDKVGKKLIEDVVGEELSDEDLAKPDVTQENESESDDGYESDLMGDEEDRRNLNTMSARDREQTLYERSEKRKAKKERAEARRKQREHQEKGKIQAKGKEKITKDTKTREKEKGIKEEKDKKKIEKDLPKEIKDSKDQNRSSTRRTLTEQEKLHDIQTRKNQSFIEEDKKKTESNNIMRLNDLQGLQIRRSDLEKLMDEPYFESFIIGKFVRVAIGERTDGQPVYRVAEIVEIMQGLQKYQFNNRPVFIRLLLRHGKAEKAFSMVLISNHSITQSEYDRWVLEMQRVKVPILSPEQALIAKRQSEFMRNNFTYDSEIVKSMIEKKRKLYGPLKNVNLALEKSKLIVARDQAKDLGDEKRLSELMKQLEEIEAQEIKERKNKQSTRNWGIHNINQKHRLANDDIDMGKDPIILSKSGIENESGEDDPFKRRATRPASIWTKEEDLSDQKDEKVIKQEKKEEKKEPRKDEKAEFKKPESKKAKLKERSDRWKEEDNSEFIVERGDAQNETASGNDSGNIHNSSGITGWRGLGLGAAELEASFFGDFAVKIKEEKGEEKKIEGVNNIGIKDEMMVMENTEQGGGGGGIRHHGLLGGTTYLLSPNYINLVRMNNFPLKINLQQQPKQVSRPPRIVNAPDTHFERTIPLTEYFKRRETEEEKITQETQFEKDKKP